jgi:hypothetical protein
VFTLRVFFDCFRTISAKAHKDRDLLNAINPEKKLQPNDKLLTTNQIAHIPIVLYPSINTEEYDRNNKIVKKNANSSIPNLPLFDFFSCFHPFLGTELMWYR